MLKKESNFSWINDYGFRAGSYSRYNRWRNNLSLMANKRTADSIWDEIGNLEIEQEIFDRMEEIPFAYIINFSDCEGVISNKYCKKLAKDFKDFEEKAIQYSEENLDDRFLEVYQDFKKSFEIASNNGLVSFH